MSDGATTEEPVVWEPEAPDPLEVAAGIVMRDYEIMPLFENAYSLLHCGDTESLWAVIFSACLQSSLSSRGLHPAVTGDAGRGKTSSIKSSLHLCYPPAVRSHSMTPKAIFYMDDICDKTIFFIDDIIMDDNLTSALKRCMSNFQDGTTHIAVNNGENVMHKIPPRSVVINTSVFSMGDDQLRDRQLIIGTFGGDDASYLQWEQERRNKGERELPVTSEVELCRKMMEKIHFQDFIVHHHKNIEFLYLTDRRLINQCYDLVEASAILQYLQRKHEVKDKIVHVWTDDKDLDSALRFSMFQTADKDTIGRLTPAERRLDQMIQAQIPATMKLQQLTESQIKEIYGKSLSAVRKLLFGYDGTSGHITGGLCEHTKWYYPEPNKETHGHVIICKKHDSNNKFGYMFARWID
jgi:hypothetical protein